MMGTRRTAEDGLTRQQRRHTRAARGGTCAGWDRETNAWRFQGPQVRQCSLNLGPITAVQIPYMEPASHTVKPEMGKGGSAFARYRHRLGAPSRVGADHAVVPVDAPCYGSRLSWRGVPAP